MSLYAALEQLLEQVDMLEDYTLGDYIEPHKAQDCWDFAIAEAYRALKEERELQQRLRDDFDRVFTPSLTGKDLEADLACVKRQGEI